ncbi:hypothetical protein LWI28_006327 [Acer negundo]|uniref:Zinc finger PMZ-type domain-containing protein n=1 Tax=Acer negundo TaxID=4023 RepID=A0AAD5P297_ACENE|nr:hypothetical protein LWI28_006327 [Acer negundo]
MCGENELEEDKMEGEEIEGEGMEVDEIDEEETNGEYMEVKEFEEDNEVDHEPVNEADPEPVFQTQKQKPTEANEWRDVIALNIILQMLSFRVHLKYADRVVDMDLIEPGDCSIVNLINDAKKLVRKDRDKPILQLSENFIRKTMVHFYEKWAKVERLIDTITPYARENLTMNEKEARKLQVIHGRGRWFETVDQADVKILVNTDDGTCDYGMWQMNELPCMHDIIVFMYNK